MSPSRRVRIALLIASVAILPLTLASCGGGSDGEAMNGGAPAAADRDASIVDGLDPATSFEEEGGRVADDGAAKVSEPIQRSVISTGVLRVATADPDQAREEALDQVTLLKGMVADEQSRSDSRGKLERVELTLRVPSSSFEKALDELAELGTLRHRQQSSEDVTTQVIDLDARVKAQAASVASIQRLLTRARTIGEIISIENQLARRQAELDSLSQQQKYLADQTSLSTIRLSITRKGDKDDDERDGFLGGLEDGWNALGDTAVALGTGLGAVLPFAAVLALIGVPGWLLYRRNRPARSTVESNEVSTGSTTGG